MLDPRIMQGRKGWDLMSSAQTWSTCGNLYATGRHTSWGQGWHPHGQGRNGFRFHHAVSEFRSAESTDQRCRELSSNSGQTVLSCHMQHGNMSLNVNTCHCMATCHCLATCSAGGAARLISWTGAPSREAGVGEVSKVPRRGTHSVLKQKPVRSRITDSKALYPVTSLSLALFCSPTESQNSFYP